MATKTRPEAIGLAAALIEHFGRDSFTAQELADELTATHAPELLTAFEDAVTCAAAASETDQLDETLWGPAPTAAQLAAARHSAQAAVDEALADALTGALTREQAARRLGVTPQAISKRLAAGGLIALSRGRERRFPDWQFHEDSVLPGLADVIATYPGTPLALTVWASQPNPDLDGRTPAQALTARDGVSRVLEAAHALTAAAW